MIIRERQCRVCCTRLGAVSPNDGAPRRLRLTLILEGQLDLRAVDELAAVPDVNVLLDDLGHPKVPDRLARRVDRVSSSLLPGVGARPDYVDHTVDAHICPPRWMCRSARFGTVMISHRQAGGQLARAIRRVRPSGQPRVAAIVAEDSCLTRRQLPTRSDGPGNDGPMTRNALITGVGWHEGTVQG